MPFDITLVGKTGSNLKATLPQPYTYGPSTDTMATITAADYFSTLNTRWKVNDMVYISASDNQGYYYVSAVTPTFTVTEITDATEITLPTGNILIGDANGVASNLAMWQDTGIMIGNGTTVSNRIISGDATMSNAGVVTVASKHTNQNMCYTKAAADSMASTPTPEFCVGTVNNSVSAATIQGIYICPNGALTADNTNYATLIFRKRAFDGGATTTLLSINTQSSSGTGSWQAYTNIASGGLLPDVTSLIGLDMVTMEITKVAAGAVVPSFNVQIVYSHS